MAGRAAMAERVDHVTRQLLAGRSGPVLVAEAAAKWGLSRRQARRIVAKGYAAIVSDLQEAGINRVDLTAQTVVALQEGMALALASGHISALVGAARELRELVGLGSNTGQSKDGSGF